MDDDPSSVMYPSHHSKHGIHMTKSFSTTRSQTRKNSSEVDFTDYSRELTHATSLAPSETNAKESTAEPQMGLKEMMAMMMGLL